MKGRSDVRSPLLIGPGRYRVNPPLPGSYDDLYREYGNPFLPGFAESHITRLLFVHTEIECHRAIQPLLHSIAEEIVSRGIESLIHTVDGCWNVRSIVGSSHPSLHSWGLAIDLNASEFPLGSSKRQEPTLLHLFARRGFFYGGDFYRRPDPMHWHYTLPHTI